MKLKNLLKPRKVSRFWKVLLTIVAVLFVDNRLAVWADTRILARHADFKARHLKHHFGHEGLGQAPGARPTASANDAPGTPPTDDMIDWTSRAPQQLCEVRRELLLYTYQTCFEFGSVDANRDIVSLDYVYVPPLPLLHWARLLGWHKARRHHTHIDGRVIAYAFRDGGWKIRRRPDYPVGDRWYDETRQYHERG